MRIAALVLAVLGGCGDPGWLLPEADAIAMADAELARRRIEISDRNHPVVTSLVTLQLDGWDPGTSVGYEYVADPDPELGPDSPYSTIAGAAELQVAVDAAVDASTRVLVIHAWAHETEELCRDQFLRNLQGRLDTLGL